MNKGGAKTSQKKKKEKNISPASLSVSKEGTEAPIQSAAGGNEPKIGEIILKSYISKENRRRKQKTMRRTIGGRKVQGQKTKKKRWGTQADGIQGRKKEKEKKDVFNRRYCMSRCRTQVFLRRKCLWPKSFPLLPCAPLEIPSS